MHLCSAAPAMHATDDAIQQLDGRSGAVAREMMMTFAENGGRWLLAHPWYTGELPMSDVATYVQQTGDRWTPPAGMRMAIGSAAVKSPVYVWMEPGSNFTSLGTSAASLYVALDKLYGHGLGKAKFRIGRAQTVNGSEVLLEPARGVTDPLPDVLTTPVGVGAVVLGGVSATCGTEPAAGDPALSLPGTDAPATRCHRDAWKETTACNFDHYDYVPDGSGGWTPITVYKKTELIQGWNISEPFTPTYPQLVDTVAFPAATTRPPVPPTWAPQTNPSTFGTIDCATNAPAPANVVQNPPATFTIETSYGACPSGWTGQITYIRVHTHYYQVGISPADVYTPWDKQTDNCAVPAGVSYNPSTGQDCYPGHWQEQSQGMSGGDNYYTRYYYTWVGNGSPLCPAPGSPPDQYCTEDLGCQYATIDPGAGAAGMIPSGTSMDRGAGDTGYGYQVTHDVVTNQYGVQKAASGTYSTQDAANAAAAADQASDSPGDLGAGSDGGIGPI